MMIDSKQNLLGTKSKTPRNDIEYHHRISLIQISDK